MNKAADRATYYAVLDDDAGVILQDGQTWERVDRFQVERVSRWLKTNL